MSDNQKKTVIVTGGSRGIGKSICLAFADPNTHLFFNYAADKKAASQTEEMVHERGGHATAIQMDVTHENQVIDFFNQVLENTGRIDVLVNNAGITRDGLLVRMKESDWNDVMDINVRGAFFCMKVAAKQMLKQRSGRIITISSVVGAMGNAGQANYASSKAALFGLTKATARELASRGITVNAVAPGFVATEMTGELSDKVKSAMLAQVPLKRVAEPEEIADAVVFLASDRAAYITGQILHVNGGMYM